MKITKHIQQHIDTLNSELINFALNDPDIIFNHMANTEENYAEGSLIFKEFSVFFRCHKSRIGYAFMEEPFLQETNATPKATIEARFKFNFSPILFSIYDIHNAVNDNNFRTLCFHNVVDKESAVDAVENILDFITKNKKTINYINDSETYQNKLISNYFEDEKVINNDFNETDFYTDISENVKMHETLMGLHLPIETGVYKFLVTGNYKLLAKQFNKTDKKNKLTVFEKRYEKHLYDTCFEKPNQNIADKLKQNEKRATATSIFFLSVIIISAILSIILDEFSAKFAINKFYSDALFLGSTSIGFEVFGLMFAPFLLITTIAFKTSRLKDKVNRLFFKEKYDKIVIIVSLIVIIASVFLTANTYKNHAIYIKSNKVFIDNKEVISPDEKPEFIYIKGVEYEDFDGNIIYSAEPEDKQLLYVFGGDYENYRTCEFYDNNGYVTKDILNQVKRADCEITTYDTIEDFAQAHDISIK